MARFIIYIHNVQYSPSDIDYVISKSRNLCSKINIIVRDVRISNHFIELDISTIAVHEILIKILAPLGAIGQIKQLGDDYNDSDNINKIDTIMRGVLHFNTERFWECHEILENIWKNCSGVEKDTLQGIILTAAALVHYQKNENSICISILTRALNKLLHSDKFYHQINIESLKKNISKIINNNYITLFTI